MAAKVRKGRRSFRNYLRGAVDEVLALGTLATKTVVATPFDEVASEEMTISSVKAIYSMQEFTEGSGDGPVMIGLAHSDYTVTEIKEFIENSGSWDRGDKISQERAKRLIRKIGVFEAQQSSSSAAQVLNGGRAINTKLNWKLLLGDTVQLWAYNLGASALATTDPQVFAEGHANLWAQS